MSYGFRIDFAGWDVSSSCGPKLQTWANQFFEDHVWKEPHVLLGWLKESHTVPGVRDVVHHYLTYWQCTKRRRYMKGWVRQISPTEFHKEAGRTPKPVHEVNVHIIREILLDVVTRSAELGSRRASALKRARDEDSERCARAFKALRRNAPSVQGAVVEAAKKRLVLLQEHLKELARLRESSGRCIMLPDDWDSILPGRLHERVGGRGVMRIRHSEETVRLIHDVEMEREGALVEQLQNEIRRME